MYYRILALSIAGMIAGTSNAASSEVFERRAPLSPCQIAFMQKVKPDYPDPIIKVQECGQGEFHCRVRGSTWCCNTGEHCVAADGGCGK